MLLWLLELVVLAVSWCLFLHSNFIMLLLFVWAKCISAGLAIPSIVILLRARAVYGRASRHEQLRACMVVLMVSFTLYTTYSATFVHGV